METKQTKPLMMHFFGQEFLELLYNVQQGKDEDVSNGFYLSNQKPKNKETFLQKIKRKSIVFSLPHK